MKKIKRFLDLHINYFIRRRTPTLVLAMQRSGSVALMRSLEAQGVFAIGSHSLDPKKLATHPFSGSARWACKHIIGKRSAAKVISLVRSPIDNILSTYARSDYGEQEIHQSGAADQNEPVSPDQLSDDFCREYLQANRHLRPLEWFENEFQAALGVNVYEHPFDRQSGTMQFRDGPYDVLVMRTELPDAQKAKVLAEFIGVPTFAMASSKSVSDTNRQLPPGKPGDQTDYAEKYKILKQSITIPQPYLDAIVDSRYVQHFFTQVEREAMQARYRVDR